MRASHPIQERERFIDLFGPHAPLTLGLTNKEVHMAPAALRKSAGTGHLRAVEPKPQESPPKTRVLRVGVVEEGRIIEEQFVRRGANVTIGHSERNTIVIPSPSLPNRQELFRHRAGGYTLSFTEQMDGRLMLEDGPVSLSALRETGKARRKGSTWQIELSEETRGKIAIGASTLLFQMVQPPPLQPKPQLPAAVKSGWIKSISWTLAAFITASFAIQFGFVTYLVNRDWPYRPMIEIMEDGHVRDLFNTPPSQSYIDHFQKRLDQSNEPVADAEPLPMELPTDRLVPTKTPRKNRPVDRGATGPTKTEPGDGGASDADRRARIADAVEQAARAHILGTLGEGTDSVVADVLAGGRVHPDPDLVMEQVRGVEVARANKTVFRQPAGSREGTASKVDLTDLRGGSSGGPALDSGDLGEERPVDGQIKQLPPRPTGGTGVIPGDTVRRIVGRDIGAIKGCYERQLRRNPTLAGRIVVSFTIGGGGRVVRATASQNTMGNAAVAQCIAGRFRRMRFPEPDGGNVTYHTPFLFRPGQ